MHIAQPAGRRLTPRVQDELVAVRQPGFSDEDHLPGGAPGDEAHLSQRHMLAAGRVSPQGEGTAPGGSAAAAGRRLGAQPPATSDGEAVLHVVVEQAAKPQEQELPRLIQGIHPRFQGSDQISKPQVNNALQHVVNVGTVGWQVKRNPTSFHFIPPVIRSNTYLIRGGTTRTAAAPHILAFSANFSSCSTRPLSRWISD